MKLWEEILVLRTRFEERSNLPAALFDKEAYMERETWKKALLELNELIKRQTRIDPTKPYVGS